MALRLSAEELDAIRTAAGRAGMAPASYTATAAVAAATGMKPPPPQMPPEVLRGIDQAADQLSALGSNLNQLARVANTTGSVVTAPTLDLLAEIDALRDRLDKLTCRMMARAR